MRKATNSGSLNSFNSWLIRSRHLNTNRRVMPGVETVIESKFLTLGDIIQ